MPESVLFLVFMSEEIVEGRRSLCAVKDAVPPFYVGVDVGGTSIKIGLVDDLGQSINPKESAQDGEAVVSIKTDTLPQAAVDSISETMAALLKRLDISNSQCGGVGLGVPTTMDKSTRKLRRPPNLPSWVDFPICDELSKAVNLPVIFCNDANAAAYGEYWVGSASGQSSLALLTLGTGIGAGIIIEGKSVDGAVGYGGECGHIVIDASDDALICGCGKRGHLEAYCSATGVARRTISMMMRRETSMRPKIVPDTKLSDIPKIVYFEAEGGDELAMEIILDTAKYLSIGIASLLHTIDVACILFGGAMTFGGKDSPLGQRFLSQVSKEIQSRVFPAIADNVLIDFAALDADAGYIGAAGLAREHHREKTGKVEIKKKVNTK